MRDFFTDTALLPDGWATDVRLRVDDSGALDTVATGASPDDAERLPGPVVPGMVNLHSHAFQRAMAGLAERGAVSPDSFWGWRARMYAFLDVLSPDDLERIAHQLYVEMLEAGYTSVVEFHYLHQAPGGKPYHPLAETSLRHLRAAEAAGIGLTHLPVLYRSSGFGGAPAEEGQRRFTLTPDQLREVLTAAADQSDDARATVGLALHSLRAVPPEELRAALNWPESKGRPIHIHVAEQLREVEDCLEWSGRRPVEWLLHNAPVDERWCLIHATHMNDAELQALAATGAVAGLCPTTEANLGDGLFRFKDYLDQGGAWGIGSDSHVSVDAAGELRLLEYGQRLAHHERNVVVRGEDASSGRRLWDGALAGGARASGRPVGALAEGRRADWIVLDPDGPTTTGRTGDDLLDALVFCEGGRPIREVWVGGERRVAEGRHLEAESVLERYRSTLGRILRRR